MRPAQMSTGRFARARLEISPRDIIYVGPGPGTTHILVREAQALAYFI